MANFKILLSILPLRLFAPVLWPLLGILLLDLVMFAALRGFFLMLTDLDLAQGTLPFSLVPALLLGNAEQALLICGGITLVIALARGFLAFRLWQSAFLRVALVQAGVSKDLFQRYMLQDYVSIRAASVSEQKLLLMHAISLTGQLMMPMTVLIIEGAVALVITLYLFVWDPLPALVLLLWMALLFAASGQLRARQSKEIGHTRWTALQDTRRHIDTALNDLGSVRITAAETRLTHQFNTATDNHTSAVARETAHAGIERHFLEAGIISLILLIYLALVYDARPPEALLPTLVVFAAACVRVFPFALRAGGYARRLKHSEADLLALKDALDRAEARPVSASPKAKHAPFEDRLTLRDIRFHYPGKRDVTPALTLTHFELPKGARLRITGPSGAGKSTFLALMLGLIDVPEGHALVDGRPQPILPALRGSAVALVPQKPLILPGTVAQNILFPDMDTEIDAARAQEILTALQLDLPLDRNVGEDGKQISGGQAQRLAIARALYAQPSLLVLDEATSHLDQRASDAVWQAIASFCPDATLVAVSHMAVPTAYFDKEVRVLDGRLSEVAQTA